MAHSQDVNLIVRKVIEDQISAGPKPDEPLTKDSVHIVGRAAGSRKPRHPRHPLPDGGHGAARGAGVLSLEETPQTVEILKCAGGPEQARHGLTMQLGRRRRLPRFELPEPAVNFLPGGMQSGGLKMLPGL